ncbi:MAG: hypothetical protein D3926_24270, partial [Desulfobacteraceae bacterium]
GDLLGTAAHRPAEKQRNFDHHLTVFSIQRPVTGGSQFLWWPVTNNPLLAGDISPVRPYIVGLQGGHCIKNRRYNPADQILSILASLKVL